MEQMNNFLNVFASNKYNVDIDELKEKIEGNK